MVLAGREIAAGLSSTFAGEASGQPAERQDLPLLANRRRWRKRIAGVAGGSLSNAHSILTTPRLILWVYVVAFVGVGAVAGVFFFRTYQEYAQLQRLETESRQRLAQGEHRLQEQERVLERLRTDPAYVEKIIRQQLKYAKPDELIFHFEE
jgi:cell division protein DivIC